MSVFPAMRRTCHLPMLSGEATHRPYTTTARFGGRRLARSSVHGLLVLDKPGGMTSRDAVNRVQAWFPPGTKIGHTGTLDPLATGVLVICLGQATRLAEYVQAMPKTYRSAFLLGARS